MKWLLAFGLLACDPIVIGPPNPPEPPKPVPVANCATACENQRALKCPLGEPTPAGGSCEDVCINASEAGIKELAWDVDKLTIAEHCEE